MSMSKLIVIAGVLVYALVLGYLVYLEIMDEFK